MTQDALQAAKTPDQRSPLLRPNLFTGAIGAAIGYIIGVWIGHRVGAHLDWVSAIDQNDVSVFLGYVVGTIGYIAGLGLLDYPFRRLLGQRPVDVVKKDAGAWRYLTVSTDHKVIGMQYLWGIGVFFFIAGLNAMLIRTNLLRPSPPIFSPGQYLTIVGLHGSMMVMMVSSIILGPFGHYLVPLMIGARRMAFPRIEALTFWLTPLSGVVLMSAISYGGFPTGWTGYPPLALQANAGMDAYIFAFFLVAVAMILNAVNLMVTIITMRAPGLSWNRLPIFVWSMLATTVLMLLGAPVLVAGLLMEALDRTSGTNFFVAAAGGSPFLFENLFWFFGPPGGLHPGAARLRHRARDPAGVRAKAALGLSPGGERPAGRGAAVVHGLAAPPVRERHQLQPAALLHADHGADLRADRVRVPGRDGHAVAGAHPLHGADAVLPCVLLQLPDRRPVGGVPVRRS